MASPCAHLKTRSITSSPTPSDRRKTGCGRRATRKLSRRIRACWHWPTIGTRWSFRRRSIWLTPAENMREKRCNNRSFCVTPGSRCSRSANASFRYDNERPEKPEDGLQFQDLQMATKGHTRHNKVRLVCLVCLVCLFVMGIEFFCSGPINQRACRCPQTGENPDEPG